MSENPPPPPVQKSEDIKETPTEALHRELDEMDLDGLRQEARNQVEKDLDAAVEAKVQETREAAATLRKEELEDKLGISHPEPSATQASEGAKEMVEQKSPEKVEGKEAKETKESAEGKTESAEKGESAKDKKEAKKDTHDGEKHEKAKAANDNKKWGEMTPKERFGAALGFGSRWGGRAALVTVPVTAIGVAGLAAGAAWGAPVAAGAGLAGVASLIGSGLLRIAQFGLADGLVLRAVRDFFTTGGLQEWANDTFGFIGVNFGKGGGGSHGGGKKGGGKSHGGGGGSQGHAANDNHGHAPAAAHGGGGHH